MSNDRQYVTQKTSADLTLTGLIALAITSVMFISSASAQPQLNVEERHLDNGLTLLLIEDHSAPVVNLQSWIGVGARMEVSGKLGLTHFFEHMMFRGSLKYGPEVHANIVQANGGHLNAYTTKDVTVFYETIAADKLELIVALEAERLQNLQITDDVLATEREVVQNERRQRTDNSSFGTIHEQLYANAFQIHPYHNPVLGWMEDIENYSVELCQDFFDSWYVPNNCTLILTGDFDPDEAFAIVKKYYGPMPERACPEPRIRQEQPQHGERRIVHYMPAQMPMLAIGYHSAALSHPDIYPLQVLSKILTDGESSRLHKRLVLDDQLAIWIGGGTDENSDPGLFTFWMTPLPTVAPEDAEAALYEELEQLASEPVEERELQKARNNLEDEFIFGLQDCAEKGGMVGHYHLRAGNWRLVNDYLDNINAVTTADLQRVAAEYFSPNNRTTVTIMPENSLPAQASGYQE